MSILEVEEGKLYQGTQERVIYTIDTTNVVDSPTTPTVKVYDLSTETDVTATIFPSNTATASGNVITLDLCRAMTINKTYRIEVLWVVSTEYYECEIFVECV